MRHTSEMLFDLTVLFSQLGKRLDHEVTAHFYEPVEIKEFHHIQGIELKVSHVHRGMVGEIIANCPTIHFNKRQVDAQHYIYLIWSPKPELVTEWYKIMREGQIATVLIRKFGTHGWDQRRKEINALQAQLESETPVYTA